MLEVAMHPPVATQAENVHPATRLARALEGRREDRVAEKGLIAYSAGDAHDILLDDSPGSDVLMPDLTVAHHAVRQSNFVAARVDQSVGVGGRKPLVNRCACEVHGVGIVPFRMWIRSPSVTDNQDNRSALRARHWITPFSVCLSVLEPQWCSMLLDRSSTVKR